MWNVLKYEIWNVSQPRMDAVNALVGGGFAPLAAIVIIDEIYEIFIIFTALFVLIKYLYEVCYYRLRKDGSRD